MEDDLLILHHIRLLRFITIEVFQMVRLISKSKKKKKETERRATPIRANPGILG